jgi:hypothetical protein
VRWKRANDLQQLHREGKPWNKIEKDRNLNTNKTPRNNNIFPLFYSVTHHHKVGALNTRAIMKILPMRNTPGNTAWMEK